MRAARKITVVAFDGFELLDATGPIELFSQVPGWTVEIISTADITITSAQGVKILADATMEQRLASAAPVDIVLIPGGRGARSLVGNADVLGRIAELALRAQLVTSVCTGSAVLARAGLLDGFKATSNKLAFEWVRGQSDLVDWQPRARWVVDGTRWTSSGVAAGMDMAHALIAELASPEEADRIAEKIELEIHNDPGEDPFAVTRSITRAIQGACLRVLKSHEMLPPATGRLPSMLCSLVPLALPVG